MKFNARDEPVRQANRRKSACRMPSCGYEPDPAHCEATLPPMIDDHKRTPLATTEKLRGCTDATDCKLLVLGPIFVRCISDNFQANNTELGARLADPADESLRSQSGR
jgi:hypothetical protein